MMFRCDHWSVIIKYWISGGVVNIPYRGDNLVQDMGNASVNSEMGTK